MEDEEKLILEYCQKLLDLLGLKQRQITLEKKSGYYYLNIESSLNSFLIGNNGENLNAFQFILRLLLYRKTGQWLKINVNAGDWWQKREESLKKMALNAAMQVKFSGKEKALPFLTSAERRIIHLALADNPDVYTQSEGVGNQRRLLIKPKKPSSAKEN